jgi:hypothetical protein
MMVCREDSPNVHAVEYPARQQNNADAFVTCWKPRKLSLQRQQWQKGNHHAQQAAKHPVDDGFEGREPSFQERHGDGSATT